VRAGRPSLVKLLGSLLLAAAIFAFLATRVDIAGALAEIQEMTWSSCSPSPSSPAGVFNTFIKLALPCSSWP